MKTVLKTGLAGLLAASALNVAAQAEIKRVAAVALDVDDLAASVAFYEAALGMTVAREYETEDMSEKVVALPGGGSASLILIKHLGEDAAEPHPIRVVFYVSDAAEALANLVAAGGEVVFEAVSVDLDTPVTIAMGRDLDGHALEFIQRD